MAPQEFEFDMDIDFIISKMKIYMIMLKGNTKILFLYLAMKDEILHTITLFVFEDQNI